MTTAKPCDQLTRIAEAHVFRLAEARDSLYGTVGNAGRTDPTGAAGSDVGQEYDFSLRARLTLHAELLINYGHFSAGSCLSHTGKRNDADFVYAQFSFESRGEDRGDLGTLRGIFPHELASRLRSG